MTPLKEATAQKHKQAERMPFNVRMFKGELTPEAYAGYLVSQKTIFHVLESAFHLPHQGFKRVEAINKDLKELNVPITAPDAATQAYANYLKNLTQDQAEPHMYLNYLALLFGGQMMKTKIPGSGAMYAFENIPDLIASVRRIQKDEWADEVNKGFDYMIDIFDELESIYYGEKVEINR